MCPRHETGTIDPMLWLFSPVLMVFALVTASSAPSATTDYTYIADTGTYTGLWALAAPSIPLTPAGHVAPMGIDVTPRGTSFTVNVDDLGTLNGLDVLVSVYGAHGRIFIGCVPVRSTTTIAGTTARDPVTVWVEASKKCSGIATAGVVTLGGVEQAA
jgi:hypothetical protein